MLVTQTLVKKEVWSNGRTMMSKFFGSDGSHFVISETIAGINNRNTNNRNNSNNDGNNNDGNSRDGNNKNGKDYSWSMHVNKKQKNGPYNSSSTSVDRADASGSTGN
jgi:hypothetical protein